jgi:hypothetical protein
METLRLPTLARLATFALLSSPIYAQTDTATSNNNITADPNKCPLHIDRDFSLNAPVNSTGSVKLHWSALMMDPARNDWIITLTYNETRNQQVPYVQFDTQHYLQAYLSAPEASEAQTCIHMFGGLNATTASDQRNGCEGVLDAGCVSFLSNATISTGCRFSNSGPEFREAFREACGADIASSLVSTSKCPASPAALPRSHHC